MVIASMGAKIRVNSFFASGRLFSIIARAISSNIFTDVIYPVGHEQIRKTVTAFQGSI